MKKTEAKVATCTENGYEAYWSCEHCDKLFSDEAGTQEITQPVVIQALGHSWGEISYAWSPDNSSVTATHICSKDYSHKEEETVGVSVVITSPTEITEGVATYTSEAFNAEGFTVQRKIIEIPMLKNLSVMYLPQQLITVEDEAFAGIDCEAVFIPDNCTFIGKHAFQDCENLLYVKVSANTIVDPDAFEGCIDVVIDTFIE